MQITIGMPSSMMINMPNVTPPQVREASSAAPKTQSKSENNSDTAVVVSISREGRALYEASKQTTEQSVETS